MGTQVPIPVQSSPNREKAMKESKLAILLLCLGCFLPINKVQGDCVGDHVLIYTDTDYGLIRYTGYYHKTDQTSRGRPVWRINSTRRWKDYYGGFYKLNTRSDLCMWIATYNYWWVGPCSNVGHNAGFAYLENRTRCPYDANWWGHKGHQVKHVEHQAVEKLRCGDEEGVMKSSLVCGYRKPMNRYGESRTVWL